MDKGVKFRVMEKADVKGPKTHPVWAFLKTAAGGGDPTWNFNAKFSACLCPLRCRHA